MTKRKSRQPKQAQSTQTRFYVILGLIAIGILVGFFAIYNASQPATVLAADGNAVSQVIAPLNYVDQFESTQHVLLDVRTPQEFNDGHIAGSINIAVETLAGRLDEVPRDQPIVVYCRSGNRSAQAAQILTQAGFTNVYDLGGIIAWEAAGLPIQ